jgi:histidyl-tRNA synthetase
VAVERITLRPDLNRVWDYYSGVVFELRTSSGIPVGGGGRYDGLIRLLSSQDRDIPAIGFGLDVDVLIAQYGTEQTSVDKPVFSVVGAPIPSAALAQYLRQSGYTVIIGQTSSTNLLIEAIDAHEIRFGGKAYTSAAEILNALKDGNPNV